MAQVITKANVQKRIDGIKAKSNALALDIHEVGIFCLQQSLDFGQITYGKQLVEALGKKHTAERVKAWLITFGAFQVKDDELVFKKVKLESREAQLKKAKEVPYWDLTKETPAEKLIKFDVLKQIAHLVAKAEKLIADTEHAEVSHAEVLAGLKALLPVEETV